ncbi:hypothetical protein Tco_1219716 [Tanacetum coccineum]
MAISSGSTPLFVRFPFRGIPIRTSLETLFPKSTEFNEDDYDVLVAHPALFQKFPEPFLCLVGMSHYYTLDEDTYLSFLHDDGLDLDLFAFIQVADPTKVNVVERERAEGEAKLLDSNIGRVVPLLPVAPARAESELEASVDKLFDEGGSTEHGDSAVGGGHDADIELVMAIEIVAVVTAKRPRIPRKKSPAVTDASSSSHPPKKLRGDYGTSSGAANGGKLSFVLKELLVSSILNVEVGVEAVPTLPLVTSSISTTPRREHGNPIDSITGFNLHTIGAFERFVISSNSSHHSSTHASEAEVDSIIKFVVPLPMMTEAVVTSHAAIDPPIPVPEMGTKITSPVHASMFHDSDSTETVRADAAGPSYSAKQDLLMGSQELNAKTLHQFIGHLAPPALFSQIREMDYHHLFMEFNIRTAHQACLNVEARDDDVENLKVQLLLKETKPAGAARLRAQQRNVALENEKDSLDGKVTELQSLVSAKDLELKDLNVVVSSLKSQNDGLVDQVAKLDADLLEMALHLEEKFYPHLVTTMYGRRWLLTSGIKLVVVKCLNSPEYLTALGSAVSRAIEKGMQNGLSADIDHEKAGRSLADVVAYNPAAKADYNFALQRLRVVDFPLLAKLSSHKDVSAADIMDLFCLESSLADAPGMIDLQPDVEQLTLPIH